MKIDAKSHLEGEWKVHELAHGLDLLDVWRYPIEGEHDDQLDDFLAVHDIEAMVAESSILVRALFGLRLLLGRMFGWDGPARGSGSAFREVYRDEREAISRIENATVRALVQLARVSLEDGRWTVEMAVYVERKGLLGRVYMALIEPFRRFFVYPSLMRAGRRRWLQRRRIAA